MPIIATTPNNSIFSLFFCNNGIIESENNNLVYFVILIVGWVSGINQPLKSQQEQKRLKYGKLKKYQIERDFFFTGNNPFYLYHVDKLTYFTLDS